MSHTVHFNGGRDARGHLDTRESKAKYTIDSCVIACPPHPQHGGHSSDRRLCAVSDQLPPEIDCLRITYGSWDHGHGECADVANALEWAHNRYDQCGLFGYSFGAALAIGVATTSTCVEFVSALAPPQSIDDGSVVETTTALYNTNIPTQLIYGTQDEMISINPTVEMLQQNASSDKFDIRSFPTGHAFQMFLDKVGIAVSSFADNITNSERKYSA